MGRLRAYVVGHPLLVDALLAVLVALMSTGSQFNAGAPASAGAPHSTTAFDDPVVALFVVAMCLPLVWRRRWPVAVFTTVLAVAALEFVLRDEVAAVPAVLVALYTVAVSCSRRVAAIALAAVEVLVLVAVVRWKAEPVWLAFVLISSLVVAAWALGTVMQTRRAYLAALEDRAARLELERDQQARLAAAAERARIMREMHDVVAHGLSVMIAQADGAAYVAGSDPQRAADAMRTVAATGRDALAEMRRLVGAQRDDGAAELSPQPGLADLDRLLDQVREAGLPVRLSRTSPLPDVPASTGLTVYRIVQEALTNVLKHAGPGAAATVTLTSDGDALDVDVRDDGRRSSPPTGTGGHGLVGMRERVAVAGGRVTAGPAPGGGWRVHARVPLDAAAVR